VFIAKQLAGCAGVVRHSLEIRDHQSLREGRDKLEHTLTSSRVYLSKDETIHMLYINWELAFRSDGTKKKVENESA
jgi:hypothetical protein